MLYKRLLAISTALAKKTHLHTKPVRSASQSFKYASCVFAAVDMKGHLLGVGGQLEFMAEVPASLNPH